MTICRQSKQVQTNEETATKKHIAVTHEDYIKVCERENKIKIKCLNTIENLVGIMRKTF